mgnify:CR=1 FL=1
MTNPFDAFCITKQSEEGVKLPLTLPNGKPTDHWLKVRGMDCPQCRASEAIYDRGLSLLAAEHNKKELDPVEYKERRGALLRDYIASFIVDWSNTQDCTKGNVVSFLGQAPQILDAVDRFVSDRGNFIDAAFTNPPTA